MRRILLALAMICVAFLPSASFGHALDPGYLDLTSLGSDRWRVTWRVPDVGGRPMPLAVRLPQTCSQETSPPPHFDGRGWTTGWIADCPDGLAGGEIRIEGLEQTNTDTLVRFELQPGRTQVKRLTAAETAFTVPADASVMEILGSYIGLGVTHILEGVDHLLFVFALLLLVPDRRRLIWTVTAFTLAHSITLAAATTGLLKIPSPPVEAVIALSIVFLAYELTLPPERRDSLTLRFPWLVSFGFGLVHGLGFAGALREIGLPDGDIPLAMFSFNVGVELGQLLFIAAVLIIGGAVKLLYPRIKLHTVLMSRVASYGIGSVAAFWVIERIAAF
ncbi:HupE/UreJ family protein [uncultured Roseibium sp.]|uniref:HupE/UreJ family protein n=1 Tax=uncultured Roseibium sp. TaxID=1936171 RepID=UPI0032170B57